MTSWWYISTAYFIASAFVSVEWVSWLFVALGGIFLLVAVTER